MGGHWRWVVTGDRWSLERGGYGEGWSLETGGQWRWVVSGEGMISYLGGQWRWVVSEEVWSPEKGG